MIMLEFCKLPLNELPVIHNIANIHASKVSECLKRLPHTQNLVENSALFLVIQELNN